MNKFKAGQKVVINSGVMRGKIGVVTKVIRNRVLLNLYYIEIEGHFDSVPYLENELRSLN